MVASGVCSSLSESQALFPCKQLAAQWTHWQVEGWGGGAESGEESQHGGGQKQFKGLTW